MLIWHRGESSKRLGHSIPGHQAQHHFNLPLVFPFYLHPSSTDPKLPLGRELATYLLETSGSAETIWVQDKGCRKKRRLKGDKRTSGNIHLMSLSPSWLLGQVTSQLTVYPTSLQTEGAHSCWVNEISPAFPSPKAGGTLVTFAK